VKITVVRGDITVQDVEAIVTAANTPLRGGGGVDAAVHASAGPGFCGLAGRWRHAQRVPP
jgi:O-acetyl-ADP-ribose deacetylase (regulator of RNase III)